MGATSHEQSHEQSLFRQSRRRFLGALGTGAAGAVAAAGGSAFCAHAARASQAPPAGRFGRMFRLPPFADPTPQVTAALLEIGRPGGLMDAHDPLERGPVDLILDPVLSRNNPDNPMHTAGTTFVGQFVDHDLTFDISSMLGGPTDPEATANLRNPAFDLDSVYGRGPVADPFLYDARDRAKLQVESSGLFEDLPRTADGTAMLGDPRNDENVIIAGLHAAFLLFHNRVVDFISVRAGPEATERFPEARRLTTWHYQWIVLHEYLPQIVGQPLIDDILARGRRFFTPDRSAYIPIEFQGAAYRFGHSMVRPSYRANLAGDNGTPFFAFVFDPAEFGTPDPGDLTGGTRAPRRFIDWQTFFDFGDGEVRRNKRIDTTISTPLFHLPFSTIARVPEAPPEVSSVLPQRNLLRQLTWGLPSGQSVARLMGAPLLSERDLQELRVFDLGFERETPLWYYILKEAEVMEDGLRLGPVGGRIVAEVFIGLLQGDLASYLAAEPRWRPTLPSRDGAGTFAMVDLLSFAGVDPVARGQ